MERLDALTVRQVGDKSYWTRIGVAFPAKSGGGWVVRLDAVPASNEGQYTIHLREPRDNNGTPGANDRGGRSAPQRQSRDLDDDVPGF